MSTRSGKRIHSTVFDNTETVTSELLLETGKKTRTTRRLKENDHQETATVKSKKRKHYVVYPTDDEGGYTTATDVVDSIKTIRKSKKTILKEQVINVFDNDNVDCTVEEKKGARVTRQTRKFSENDDEAHNEAKASEESHPNRKQSKKHKKKKSKSSDINENITEPLQDIEMAKISKKPKKNKRGKRAKTSEEVKKTLNKSSVSTDSFHSAAGSPQIVVEHIDSDAPDAWNKDITLVEHDKAEINTSTEKGSKIKRKSVNKTITPEKASQLPETSKRTRKATTEFKEIDITATEKRSNRRKSSIKLEEEVPQKSNILNSTYDKLDTEEVNLTLGEEPKARRSLRLSNITSESTAGTVNGYNIDTTFEKDSNVEKDPNKVKTANNYSGVLNSTFEKAADKSKTTSLNSTLDKSITKLNTTFDKTQKETGKSSLISSDEGTVNLTYDKDNSATSITSDESKENIVNTTPLLIESSIDESRHSSKLSKSLEGSAEKPTKITPPTPLKREGTFTKESPEVKAETPTKKQTLPSPGFTPFHISRSSIKERSVLNVTRSLEKSRRSSLTNFALERQTRVMFCSPVNNPAVVIQQKKKIIKSSMKGSNKSFVFDDTASPRQLEATRQLTATRKRSYTQGDADDTRAKRTRRADDLQLSVDRLSRPRTSTANAKQQETPKKQATPSKSKTDPKRTRLPNFAALHQKQFDKMESLTDCQQRKMRRAKKMLVPKTPNGTVMVLERSSPRGTPETAKSKNVVAKKSQSPVKTETAPKKPELSKLPTLESLRPGFTRFGFKMHTEHNPFSIPSKIDTKPKTNLVKPNGMLKQVPAPKTPALGPRQPPTPALGPRQPPTPALGPRQPPLPSLNGTTSRREAAKQTIMREKSFTSLSNKINVKRNECRTIIKGVRTNRRFELQMKMRNID